LYLRQSGEAIRPALVAETPVGADIRGDTIGGDWRQYHRHVDRTW